MTIDADEEIENSAVALAIYSGGRMIGVQYVPIDTLLAGESDVPLDIEARIFLVDHESLKPYSEAYTADIK